VFNSVITRGNRQVDRLIVLAGLGILVTISWMYLFYIANDTSSMNMPMGPDMQDGKGMSAMKPSVPMAWSLSEWFAMFTMWSVMMIGMMIPSASPMILVFSKVNRQKKASGSPYGGTGIFVAGYIIIWSAFSVLATMVNFILHSNALLSGMMGHSDSMLLGGFLLVIAGIFQWTPWKDSCLSKCRTPMGFLITEWRDGSKGALVMGLKHGAYCVGCCWLIMALLFVLGVMNLVWIAALSVFVLVEKIVPNGLWIGRVSGLALIVWGLILIIPTISG